MADKTAKQIIQSIILCVLTLWIMGCSLSDHSTKFHHISGPTMGTWYNVKFQALPPNLSMPDIKKQVNAVLNGINQKMSTYQPDSELSTFNQVTPNTSLELSTDTIQVLEISKQVYAESNGAFDVTVGPLVNLWGFGPNDRTEKTPDVAEIQNVLSAIGTDAFELGGHIATKSKPVEIDLSAVAKGYAVDKVALMLESLGISHYMVEVGGEIRVGKRKLSGEPWKIAIEEPTEFERSIQKVLNIENVSVATSGDYRNYYEADGERYSHTIDPRTGYPVKHNLASVTVIHESCAYADAYATALTVLGPEKSLEFAEKLDLAIYMLVKSETGFDVLQTKSFSSYVDPASI